MSSWNRLYRPTKISDLHLTEVREEIDRFLRNGNFPQAWIFAGPKGTGKTSASRIIGATLNDVANSAYTRELMEGKNSGQKFHDPDTSDPLISAILRGESYVVHEMDAASNRGIDDIRQLKERIFLPPQEGIVSVYILDEAHMLTTDAFNALLKVLEEPPAHVIFILATTELHKIPSTIQSRCHVLHFKKATKNELSLALETILNREKIKSNTDAINAIIEVSDGSFRDAIKYAELSVKNGKIDITTTESVTGISSNSFIEQLVQAIIQKNSKEVVTIFSNLRNSKAMDTIFHTLLLQYLHSNLKISIENPELSNLSTKICLFLLAEFSQESLLIKSPIPLLPFELKSLEIIARAQQKGGKSSEVDSNKDEKESVKKNEIQSSSTILADTSENTVVPNESVVGGNGALLCEKWEQFTDLVALSNSTVAALLKSAKPVSGTNGEATVQVYYSFHQEQLQQPKIRQHLNSPLTEICGGTVNLRIIKADSPHTADIIDVVDSHRLEALAAEALL